jgi:hypothetical protein
MGEILKELGVEYDVCKYFSKELAHSESPSVDAFLESRPEYMGLGKLAIAIQLVSCENQKRLINVLRDGDEPSWYYYLFNKMVESRLEDFKHNDLSIITFNYDRSLEFYLFGALTSRFGSENEKRVKQILLPMRIIHVHGSLGEAPWEPTPCRPYKEDLGLDTIKALSKQIIVMSESQQTSMEFEIAQNYLKMGTAIYFLGFGYHQKNLERLEIKKFSGRQLYGSSLGLEKGEIKQVSASWGIQFPEAGLGILDLFRRYFPIDQS